MMRVLLMVSITSTFVIARQGNAVFYKRPLSYTRHTGNATYYKPPYTPSSCDMMKDMGVWVAGVREELWNKRKACGRKYNVTCIKGANEAPDPCKQGKSVVVTVVDYCKPKCNGIKNLSQDAFSVIADLQAGKVTVEFTQV